MHLNYGFKRTQPNLLNFGNFKILSEPLKSPEGNQKFKKAISVRHKYPRIIIIRGYHGVSLSKFIA